MNAVAPPPRTASIRQEYRQADAAGQSDLAPRLISPRILLGLAFGLSLLAYVPALRFDFVYDDPYQIVNNPKIHDWSHVRGYFTSHLWANAGSDWVSNYYRPLFLIWLRVDYALFGVHAAYWHAASIALHLLAIWLVFVAARELLELLGGETGAGNLTAALAALLFGLHPVHTEAVAWLSASSELLLTIFCLGAFASYCQARRSQKSLPWEAASVALFAAALLTKETALLLVVVVLVCEWVQASRTGSGPRIAEKLRRSARRTLPWAATAALYLVVRRLALGELGHTQVALPLGTVFKSVPALLWFYCRHLWWPTRLSELYEVSPVSSLRSPHFLLPALGVGMVAAVLVALSRRSAVGLLASVWMAVTLVPVLDVAVLRPDALVADRYLYLPSFGFCLLVGMLLHRLSTVVRVSRSVAFAAVALLAVVMGVVTTRELAPWENDLLLFQNAAQVAPHNALANANLGAQMLLRGESERARQLLLASYAIDPHAWMTAYNLAYLYYSLGDLGQAELFVRRAIAIDAHNKNQYMMLALTLKRLGRFREAEAAFRKTMEVWPQAPLAHLSLAEVLEQQGRYDEALSEFQEELNGQNPGPARQGIARVQAEKAAAGKR